MKKSIFVSLGILSLLVVGGASFALSANRQEFKEAKADPVELTVNPTGNFADNGSKNVIDLECTPENAIPVGWDAGALVQTSRDAVIINGQYLQDQGGNITMRKQGAYRYTICIDSVWKFHDIIQDNDIVIVGGQWAQGDAYVVTLTPLCVQWTGSQWIKLDTYDIGSVTFSIDESRKNDANQLFFAAATENLMPANMDWSIRAKQGSDDGFIFNGVETKPATGKKVDLIKLSQNLYVVYIPDVGSPYNSVATDDIITIQGIYVYQYSPRFVLHLHVQPFSAAWDGTQWVAANQYLRDSSLDNIPANSLLRNIGKYNPANTKSSIKNFDQNPSSLVYKKDYNDNTGYYFTSSAGAKSEVRFYLPDNAYKTESKGYAVKSVSFDYMLTNTNKIAGTATEASLTPEGYFTTSQTSETTPYMMQLMDSNNPAEGYTGEDMTYYSFNEELIDDGNLHTYTLNVAFGDICGINICLFSFKGTFFISNLQFTYNAYDADLNHLVRDSLHMYVYHDNNNTCLTYYAGAKAAYLALSLDQKALFASDSSYASAKARLAAWADANGDVFDAAAGTITAKANMRLFNGVDNQNSVAIIIAIAMSSSVALLGVLLVLKKKHKYN